MLSYYDLVHVLRAYGSLFVCVCVFVYIVSVTLILELVTDSKTMQTSYSSERNLAKPDKNLAYMH